MEVLALGKTKNPMKAVANAVVDKIKKLMLLK